MQGYDQDEIAKVGHLDIDAVVHQFSLKSPRRHLCPAKVEHESQRIAVGTTYGADRLRQT